MLLLVGCQSWRTGRCHIHTDVQGSLVIVLEWRCPQSPSTLHCSMKRPPALWHLKYRRPLGSSPKTWPIECKGLGITKEEKHDIPGRWANLVKKLNFPSNKSIYGWNNIWSPTQEDFWGRMWKVCLFTSCESTSPKFNIAPENGWLEDYFPFGKVKLQETCQRIWANHFGQTCNQPTVAVLFPQQQ